MQNRDDRGHHGGHGHHGHGGGHSHHHRPPPHSGHHGGGHHHHGGHHQNRPPPEHHGHHHGGGGAGGSGGHHQHRRQQPHHRPPPPPGHHHGGGHQGGRDGVPAKWHSFKMLVDPQIHQGASRMIRYDGTIVPGNPHHVPPTPSDPRTYRGLSSALWRRLEPMELDVPKMKIDENYVGDPPKVEVTIENLNDNVDGQFLHGMVQKLGAMEEMTIAFHPVTRKHLGLARIVFEEVRSAKECVRVMHQKSVMGKQLNCYLDPSGASYKHMFQELTAEKKPEPEPPQPSPSPPPPAAEAKTKDEKPPSPRDSKWEKRDRDPRSLDARERRDRHSGERRRSDGGSRRDRHRRSEDHGGSSSRWGDSSTEKEKASTSSYDHAKEQDDDYSHHHRHPPPPPPTAVGGNASNPPVNPASHAATGYQPTTFDPQYSSTEYWLKQAQMYTANAAAAAQRSMSQDSDAAAAAMEASASSSSSQHGPSAPLPSADKLFGEHEEDERRADDEVLAVTGGEGGKDAKTEDDSDTEDHKVDLDTRLKMLMKDKTGAMPAFLLDELNGSESDDEQEDDQKESATAAAGNEVQAAELESSHMSLFPLQPDEVPLSRPPSPFLSAKNYLQCHKEWVEERRRATDMRDFQGVKQALDAGFLPQPPLPPHHPHHPRHFHPGMKKNNGRIRPHSRGSDQMSLSSLSSGDNNILEEGGPHMSAAAAAAYYSQYYPPPLVPGQEWNGEYDPYGHPFPQHHHPHAFDPNLMQYEGYYQQWWGQPPDYGTVAPEKADPKHNIRPLIKQSVKVFVEDLKKTLTKDINKRMCETFAFFIYDKWWQEQEEKYKAKKQTSKSSASSSATTLPGSSAASVSSTPKSVDASESTPHKDRTQHQPPSSSSASSFSVPNSDNFSSLFDKQREKLESGGSAKGGGGAFGMGGSLGFGFRGTIPKMPSFKKKSSRPKADGSGRHGSSSRRDYSSDEDDHRSSSRNDRRGSDKRREQEKRREHRLEKEKKDRDRGTRDKDKDGVGKRREDDLSKGKAGKHLEAKGSSDKKDSISGKGKKTLDSIYSAIYSDKSEDDKSSAVASSSDSSSSPEIGRKAASTKKKGAASSSDEDEEEETSMSDSEAEISSVASSSSSRLSEGRKSPSTSAGSESSSVASSEDDEEYSKKSVKPKKKKVSTPSRSISASPSSSSDSEEDGKARGKSEEDMEVDVEASSPLPTPAKNEDAVKKKPTPMRKPSLTKSTTEDEDDKPLSETFSVPTAPPRPAAEKAPPSTPSSSSAPEATVKIPEESPPHIIDHCYAKPAPDAATATSSSLDHGGYTRQEESKPTPPSAKPGSRIARRTSSAGSTTPKTAKGKSILISKQEQPSLPARAAKTKTYKERDMKEQFDIVYRFLTKGLDLEDVGYLKRSYAMMLDAEVKKDQNKLAWLNDTHWVDHPVTDIPTPPKKKSRSDFSREHTTGSCRTEGYYKMDPREKAQTKYHLLRDDAIAGVFSRAKIGNLDGSATKGRLQTAQSLSREARSAQRRQLAVLGDELSSHSDLLKFNQLKFRRKQMIFGKSAIHDWGLFAMEDIGADEMVIEYVGHVIRPVVSDVWEKAYEKQGIGSSYLFRIDLDYVVDATKRGNLARFINHSCDPNCYAKVITVDQQKKIVIYSKQPIATGEEITYDYKFPIEDEKIVCLCQAKNCRKYLN